MVLVMLTLGLLLLSYFAAKAADHSDPDRSRDQEREDAAKNRQKWRHRAIDWQF